MSGTSIGIDTGIGTSIGSHPGIGRMDNIHTDRGCCRCRRSFETGMRRLRLATGDWRPRPVAAKAAGRQLTSKITKFIAKTRE